MTDQSLRQLESMDPARRREAILALGKSRDRRALAALEQVVAREPDPALRELALKAIQHLQKTNASAKAPVIQPTEPETVPVKAAPAEVSAARKRLAQGKIKQAYNLHHQGKIEMAMAALAEAVRADPALADAVTAQQLAAGLMGSSVSRGAIDLILGKIEREGTPSGGPLVTRDLLGPALTLAALFGAALVLSQGVRAADPARLGELFMYALSPSRGFRGDLPEIIAHIKAAALAPNLAWEVLRGAVIAMASALFGMASTFVFGTVLARGAGTLLAFGTALMRTEVVMFILFGAALAPLPLAVLTSPQPPGLESATTFTGLSAFLIGAVSLAGIALQTQLTRQMLRIGPIRSLGCALFGALASLVVATALGLFR
jgi:hypothetical protein